MDYWTWFEGETAKALSDAMIYGSGFQDHTGKHIPFHDVVEHGLVAVPDDQMQPGDLLHIKMTEQGFRDYAGGLK